MSSSPLTFGIIGGFGSMASPMARHLSPTSALRIDRVYDRRTMSERHEIVREQWRQHGATLVHSYSDLVGNGDLDGVIVCCGKNGDDVGIVAELARRLGNTIRGNPPIICHLSTVSDRFVEAAQIYCSEREVRYVNYPLTGGPVGAENRSMLILAAGDRNTFDALHTFLELIGKPRYLGHKVTLGCHAKLIGHAMVFNGLMAISTAVALHSECFQSGRLGGEEQGEFFDFLNQGAGGTRQWEVAASKGVKESEYKRGFFAKHAVVDSLYAADLCLSKKLAICTADSLLTVAIALTYVVNRDPELATHALLQDFIAGSAAQLDAFSSSIREGSKTPRDVLERCTRALPSAIRSTVALEISNQDFGASGLDF